MLDFDKVWLPTMIVSFLAFMVLFNIILIKPLLKVIDERNSRIQGALDEARRADEQLKETLAKIDSELGETRRQAKAIIEKEQAAGLAAQQKLLAEANEQAAEVSRKAQAELKAMVDAARVSLKTQAASLADEIAGKLVGSRS